jgi:hypothetical protein
MCWKFWRKSKHHDIEGLIKAIGRFPNLTEVTEGKSESETKPNPLIDLIRKAQTIDELTQLYDKYENSLTMASIAVFIFRNLEIKLNDLQKRVSVLEEKIEEKIK